MKKMKWKKTNRFFEADENAHSEHTEKQNL